MYSAKLSTFKIFLFVVLSKIGKQTAQNSETQMYSLVDTRNTHVVLPHARGHYLLDFIEVQNLDERNSKLDHDVVRRIFDRPGECGDGGVAVK